MEKKNKLGALHISRLDERDETITVWNMNLWWRRGNKFDGLTHAPWIIYCSHNVCMYAVRQFARSYSRGVMINGFICLLTMGK